MPVKRDPESGETVTAEKPSRLRLLIAKVFTHVEDALYLGLGFLLACSAIALLVTGAVSLWQTVAAGVPADRIVNVLDRILLILLVVELLYTVKVSFREHALVPEPFLIVGLIAATRRILIVTAEAATALEKGAQEAFRNAMIELGVMTLMVLALVGSLLMLGKRSATPVPDRS